MGKEKKDKQPFKPSKFIDRTNKPPVTGYRVGTRKENAFDKLIRQGLENDKIPVGYGPYGEPIYRNQQKEDKVESTIRALGRKMIDMPYHKWTPEMMSNAKKYLDPALVARIVAAKEKAKR